MQQNEFKLRLLLLGLPFLLLLSGAEAQTEVLTPHMLARIQYVDEAQISPDGEKVAYTRVVQRLPGIHENGPAWEELHLYDLNSEESRPFVTGKVNVGSIGWLPDGSAISFLAKRDGDEQTSLYTIAADGGEARKIVELETDIDDYTWSPDGRRVALMAGRPDPAEKTELEAQGFDQQIYEEDWLHRALYVAMPGSDEEPQRLEDLDSSVLQAVWSPDSSKIGVSLAPTPLVDDSYMQQRVAVIGAASGGILARIQNRGKLQTFAWSPDASQLVLIAGVDIHDPAAGQLMVAPATGGEPELLIPGHEGHVQAVAWPEADTIRFIDALGVWTQIREISPDGGSPTEITPREGPIFHSMSLSGDGTRAALVADSPAHPQELFLLESGEEEARRLTVSNPWLEGVRLARQEVVTYVARDGLEIEGLLIRPLDEVSGRRYPLLLTVHGGPESHYSNGWLSSYSRPGQVAAARGIAVFYPNYRGSTGRGVKFSKLSQAEPAGEEFDDLVDGVDHLIESGLVDRDRVAVTGGSYGGYATAWCSTYYSDRFAAGVMFVGISNKLSKVGTTDIPEEEFLVHALKRPWDDWQFFLERSPIYYAGQSETPLLILHGTADPRVNVGQSREMYRHLKIRSDAPVRLVLYPGEQHGNRRAASRLDYSLRSLRWIEHYLLGPGGVPPDFTIDYDLQKFEEDHEE